MRRAPTSATMHTIDRVRAPLAMRLRGPGAAERVVEVEARVETRTELEYLEHGGLLPYVLDLFSTTDQLLVFMDPYLPRAVSPGAWAQIYQAATEVSRSAACPSSR